MDVVPVARPARIHDSRKAAADRGAALKAKGLEPSAPEIRLQDEAVVPRAEENAVVRAQSFRITFILIDLSRKALV